MLAIEIIEGCNFKCYFCIAKDLVQPVFMNLDLFKKTVLEAKALGITKINLTPCKGEPFMHPDIYEMLDFVNLHMKEVLVFSNATAINVDKLKKINLTNINLCISYYGSTVEKFKEITGTNDKLFKIFHTRLDELKQADIKHEVHRRDQNYQFDYPGSSLPTPGPLDTTIKCKYHQEPKVFANGDVSFCQFIREEAPFLNKIFYANLNQVNLKEALEDPLRFKFYDSQSICSKLCSSYNRDCYTGYSVVSLRLITKSKNNYKINPTLIDAQYAEIEKEVADEFAKSNL